jgi:hypothetical protein
MQEQFRPRQASRSSLVFLGTLLRQSFETWTLESGWFLFYGFFMLMAGAALGQIPVAGLVLALAVEGPLAVGLVMATRRVALHERTGPEDLFAGFRGMALATSTGMLALSVAGLSLLGFVALIVPGLLAAAFFSVALPVMVLEGCGVLESLKRSARLVKPRLAPILLIMLGFGLLELLLALPTLRTLLNGAGGEPDTMQTLPFMLGMGLLGPLQGIVSTLLYMHLREESGQTLAQG